MADACGRQLTGVRRRPDALTSKTSRTTMPPMRKLSSLLLLTAPAFVACATSLSPPAPDTTPMTTSASPVSAARPADGAYIGRIDAVHQSVSLQIRPDDSARVVVVYALHTPPAMVEEYEGRLVEREDGWCLEPAPKSVQPCLDLSGEWPALTRVSGERIDLRRVER